VITLACVVLSTYFSLTYLLTYLPTYLPNYVVTYFLTHLLCLDLPGAAIDLSAGGDNIGVRRPARLVNAVSRAAGNILKRFIFNVIVVVIIIVTAASLSCYAC